MADLATLKARIATELHRTDLTSQIANAISDAIEKYRSKRFEFNEQQATFSTIASQQAYSSADAGFPTDIGEIDSVRIAVNGRYVQLTPKNFNQIEKITYTDNDIGVPDFFAWYSDKLWFYLIPNTVYSVRLSYQQRKSAPANDADATTVWTGACEPLIRACAKRIVVRDYIYDDALEARCQRAEDEAFHELLDEATDLQNQGDLQENW